MNLFAIELILMKHLFLSICLLLGSFMGFSQVEKDTSIVKKDTNIVAQDSLKKSIEKALLKESESKTDTVTIDSTLSYAEEYKRDRVKTIFGIRGGLTLTRFITQRSEVLQLQSNGFPIIPFVKEEIIGNEQNVLSYMGGIFLRVTKGSFFFQPEIDYTIRGGKIDILQKSGSVKRIESTFTSIDLPVMFGIRFRQGRLFAGPVGIFQFAFSKNLEETLQLYATTDDEIKGNLFQRPSFGIQAGLGFDFKKIFIEGRYEMGLSNFTNYDLGVSSNPAKFVMQPQGFQITIGFLSR